jgi:hypothetical protein
MELTLLPWGHLYALYLMKKKRKKKLYNECKKFKKIGVSAAIYISRTGALACAI